MPIVAKGGTVTLHGNVAHATGYPVDAPDLTLTVLDSNGAPVAPFPVAIPPIVHDGLGEYHCAWAVPSNLPVGDYTAIWAGIVDGESAGGSETVEVVAPGAIGVGARGTMAALITRLRLLIGDPLVTVAGTPPSMTSVFTDAELQDFLDSRRTEVLEAQVLPRPTGVQGPMVSYRDYFAPRGMWEDSVILKDAAQYAITPATSDLIRGHWTFAANQVPPVFITGNFYDLYGSAAAALDAWGAKVALEFDFGTDRQTFSRSQKREGLESLAKTYRRLAVQPGKRPEWRGAYW